MIGVLFWPFSSTKYSPTASAYLVPRLKILPTSTALCSSSSCSAKLDLAEHELEEHKAVEVGNIFNLGTKYAEAVGLYFVDENGQKRTPIMGSYGIGISRLMGLLAEHFADEHG